jgi:predicted kinase
MPTVYMMVGVPASGKSTFITNSPEMNHLPVASTDKYIEYFANFSGKTYDEVFSETIGIASKYMDAVIGEYVKTEVSFIWDQTNLTAKSRAKKLARVPKHWKKVAVYIALPDEAEHERRLASRPGKTIPKKILEDMKKQLEVPDLLNENFDRIMSNVPMEV